MDKLYQEQLKEQQKQIETLKTELSRIKDIVRKFLSPS